jgi:uncharacterized membrane protein YhiD involved in acid resistance
MVIFTFLLAFLCSSLIAFTYYVTSPKTLKTGNYVQSLILSSLIATMILQSIGDSLASGLGILGALTIINFRTSFRDPRDIVFIFAALGTGIACGSYMLVIAILGTSTFCFVALSLRFTPFHMGNHIVWEVRVLIEDAEKIPEMERIIGDYCLRSTLDDIRNETRKSTQVSTQEREYSIVMRNEKQQVEFMQALEAIGITVKKLSKQSSNGNEIAQ